jgi:hypothetical protein
MNAQMGLDINLYSRFNLSVKYGVVVISITRLLYSMERHPVPNVQKEGWAKTGQVQKISPPLELDPQTAQPVVSPCTDYAIPAHITTDCNLTLTTGCYSNFTRTGEF